MTTATDIAPDSAEGFNLSEPACRALRSMANNFSFPPGERLNERRLTRSLGVSCTPLREAPHRLAAEGLLVLAGGRDMRCSPPATTPANR